MRLCAKKRKLSIWYWFLQSTTSESRQPMAVLGNKSFETAVSYNDGLSVQRRNNVEQALFAYSDCPFQFCWVGYSRKGPSSRPSRRDYTLRVRGWWRDSSCGHI